MAETPETPTRRRSTDRRLTIEVDVAEKLGELEGKIDRLTEKLDNLLTQKASTTDLVKLANRVEKLEEHRDSDAAVAAYKARVWKVASIVATIVAAAFGGLVAILH